MEDLAVVAHRHRLRPSGQHQHYRTTVRDESKRLVGRIEEEHPLHTPERLSAPGPRALTPAQVGHHVLARESGDRPVAAVDGLETELPVRLTRHRQERRAPPPATPRHPARGTDGRTPERGPRPHRRQDDAGVTAPSPIGRRDRRSGSGPLPGRARSPRHALASAHPATSALAAASAPTPRSPTRAAPISGPRSPSAPGTIRAPRANDRPQRRSISSWAARKKGSPNPRATEPDAT